MPMAAPFQWGLLKAREYTLRPLVAAGRSQSASSLKCYFFAAIAAASAAACETR